MIFSHRFFRVFLADAFTGSLNLSKKADVLEKILPFCLIHAIIIISAVDCTMSLLRFLLANLWLWPGDSLPEISGLCQIIACIKRWRQFVQIQKCLLGMHLSTVNVRNQRPNISVSHLISFIFFSIFFIGIARKRNCVNHFYFFLSMQTIRHLFSIKKKKNWNISISTIWSFPFLR